MAGKAFEDDLIYSYNDAFAVSPDALLDAWRTTNSGNPTTLLHGQITGKQSSYYAVWRNANPNTKLLINDMVDIELRAMKDVGIPEDIARGWIIKSLEDLKYQNVIEIKKIPWGGLNP